LHHLSRFRNFHKQGDLTLVPSEYRFVNPENLNENTTLTIASGIRLDIDFSSHHLRIKNGAKLVIKADGKIY
jgi:hypothetical protein